MDLKQIKLDCCAGRFERAMEQVVNDESFLVEGHRNNTAVNACCVMWAWKGDAIEEEVNEEIAEGRSTSRYLCRSAIVDEKIRDFVLKVKPEIWEDVDWYDFEERVDKIAWYLDDWGPGGFRHYALDYMMAV